MISASLVRKLIFLCLVSLSIGCSPNPELAGGPADPGKADTIPVLQVMNELRLPAALKESSGLCYTDGNLWTFADSGNPNQIYRIDPATGNILQTVVVSNFSNVDWEDIAADSLFIYIGDFGNNNGNRKDLKVIRIRKSDLRDGPQDLDVAGESIQFSYADQQSFKASDSTDFDCESLIAFQDNLYLFSKDAVDSKTRCYRLSKLPGKYSLSPVATFNVGGRITAAACNHQTNEVALLGYLDKSGDGHSFVWFFNDFDGDNFFGGSATRYRINAARYIQTEGIEYASEKTLFMSCETDSFEDASLYLLGKP